MLYRLAFSALLFCACSLGLPLAHAQSASSPPSAPTPQPLLSSSINDFTNEDSYCGGWPG